MADNMAPTGIPGFDQLTGGGVPQGGITLVSGGPGTGKTTLALQFLIHGAKEGGEPGILISCLEAKERLLARVAALDAGTPACLAGGQLSILDATLRRTTLPIGDFDLQALVARADHLAASRGARRIAIDAPHMLVSLHAHREREVRDLREIFRWLSSRGLTAVVTASPGASPYSVYGLEEYLADCVVLLEQRAPAPRSLRILKCRGSACVAGKVPFEITVRGLALDGAPSGPRRPDHVPASALEEPCRG